MSPRTRCAFTNCTRYARPGLDRCSLHRDKVDYHGKEPTPLARSIAARDYGPYSTQVHQAAADADDSVDNEILVLRTVLDQLLAEETDPSKLASGVAKISSTIIQAMRTKRILSGSTADDFTDALTTILEELKP